MAEIITLTTPIAKPSQTGIRMERIIIDFDQKSLFFQWLGNNNEAGSASYPTPAILNPLGNPQPSGATLLNNLNNANLSTTSLVKRILQRLQTDGYITAGTISGTPD